MHRTGSTTGKTLALVIVALAVVGVGIWFASLYSMGTPYKANSKQTVYYSGTSTEADAKRLADALIADGFFDEKTGLDVLLNKSDEGVTTISFVTQSVAWTDPAMTQVFKDIADRCSYAVGGLPLKVKLIDEHLKTQKELDVQTTRWGKAIFISAKEKIYLQGSATEADGKALGAALKEAGYFSGTGVIDVLLDKGPQVTAISFVTTDAAWSDPQIHEEFRTIGEAIAPSVGGKPIKVLLIDGHLTTQKAIDIK